MAHNIFNSSITLLLSFYKNKQLIFLTVYILLGKISNIGLIILPENYESIILSGDDLID
jgi:hypothetical protein